MKPGLLLSIQETLVLFRSKISLYKKHYCTSKELYISFKVADIEKSYFLKFSGMTYFTNLITFIMELIEEKNYFLIIFFLKPPVHT